MSVIQPRSGTILDFAATVALAASVVLLLIVFLDLFTAASETAGGLVKATLFLGVLATPTICCAIVWPIHLCQKRRGQRTFGGLRYVVMASSVWMWFVFVGVTGN